MGVSWAASTFSFSSSGMWYSRVYMISSFYKVYVYKGKLGKNILRIDLKSWEETYVLLLLHIWEALLAPCVLTENSLLYEWVCVCFSSLLRTLSLNISVSILIQMDELPSFLQSFTRREVQQCSWMFWRLVYLKMVYFFESFQYVHFLWDITVRIFQALFWH